MTHDDDDYDNSFGSRFRFKSRFGGKDDDKTRAMKLHHKLGVTLKEAWKIIKEEGETSSPSRKKVPCKKGQIRDPITHRCKNMLNKYKDRDDREGKPIYKLRSTRKRSSKSSPKSSPKNKKSLKKYVPCLDGQIRDPVTHRCRNLLKDMRGKTLYSLNNSLIQGPKVRSRYSKRRF